MSLSPLCALQVMPEFQLSYNVDYAMRQKIADSWPRSLDDSLARRDWQWAPDYDLDAMTREMLKAMRKYV